MRNEKQTGQPHVEFKGDRPGSQESPGKSCGSHGPLARLFHPETFSDARITHPLAAAVWNSIVGTVFTAVCAFAVCFFEGLLDLARFGSLKNLTYVEAGLIALCGAHAFLGARIGARKAANVLGLMFGLAAIAVAYYYTRG